MTIKTVTREVYITSDGREFDTLNGAKRHDARARVEEMVEEHGLGNNPSIGDVVEVVVAALIYIPRSVVEDLML